MPTSPGLTLTCDGIASVFSIADVHTGVQAVLHDIRDVFRVPNPEVLEPTVGSVEYPRHRLVFRNRRHGDTAYAVQMSTWRHE